MNKEAVELVKQYIQSTAQDGISEDSYKLLGYMLQVDRTLAMTIGDIYEQIEPTGARYQIPNDSEPYEL
jgi:hypothetical protein